VYLGHVTRYGLFAISVLIASPFVYGQYPCSCVRDKPFIADRAEHIDMEFPDGSNHPLDSKGTLARDIDGRIYGESHPAWFVGKARANPANNDGVGFSKQGRPQIHTIVSISDCIEHKNIMVFPEIRTAQVATMPKSVLEQKNPTDSSYSETLIHISRPPNAIVEDLGFREMGQIRAHGFKVTVLGTEQEPDWNGRPTSISEQWVSDELEIVILEIRTNVKGKNKSTITVSNIRREQPNPALFQIPPDYTITPPQEMHFPASNSEPQ
jgi:hypothetical protein